MKATLLWKRIPKSHKIEKSELNSLWNLIQLLIQSKYAQLFELANLHIRNTSNQWSTDELKNLFNSLIEKTKERLFDLISIAYSSINIKEMATMFGISGDETVRICLSRGWTLDETHNFLIPKKKRIIE